MLFGNALNLDRGIFLPPLERPVPDKPLSASASRMLRLQDEIMAKARDILRHSDDLHMALHATVVPTQFLPGSFVLVKYRTGAPPTRMHTFWKGPLKVLSNDRSIYKLHDLITSKEKDYHISDLKAFYFDPLQVNPIDIARRDYLEFFVEKILGMRGDKKRSTTLEFHIKWVGYDDTHNSYEPWKNLRDLSILHEYLYAHNLSQIIPKKHRVCSLQE